MQAAFVLEQAAAWKAKRPEDNIVILAPHDRTAARHEWIGPIEVFRFRYFVPERLQALAYPAILPNIKANPLLALEVPPFLWSEYRAARRLVRERGIDLVYAHWVMPQGVVASALKAVTGVPYVLHNHSSDLSIFERFGGLGRGLARRVIAGAAAMFCVNRDQKAYADAMAPAAADRIRVLPMGVQPDALPLGDAKPASSFGTLSRLSRKKGLDLLIEATRRIAATEPGISLAIAGDGEERERLQALAAGTDVRFPGFLTGAGKRRFFDEAKVFVFPAVAAGSDVEGLPVALLEALCAGKPVVASRDTNIAMLPEWDRIKGDVAFVEDPRDIPALAEAMRSLLHLSDPEAAARAGRLRSVMQRYRWDRLIDEYLAVIDSAQQPRPQV